MANKMAPDQEYFATLADPDQLAAAMAEKITKWRTHVASRGLVDLWKKKLGNYYGISANGNNSQQLMAGGSEGELTLIKVNDLHSLIQEQLVLVTSQRPAGMAKAVNTDSASLKSARIGSAIAEYYMANVGWEAKFVAATETALLCDEAFIDLFWDKNAGDAIAMDPETGDPEMSGDAVLRTHSPWNVTRDIGAKVEQQKWYILSYTANKYDMAASYPKFSDEILNAKESAIPTLEIAEIPDGSDMIYVHLLVHDRTPAVPVGRYALLISDRIVLDTKLPYKDFSVERIAPSDVIDGPIGYSAANDIMGLEELTDALHSTVASNNITFGTQSIVGPNGGGLNISDLGKGLRFFEVAPEMVDKIKPLQMTRTAPETFSYIDKLESKKQQQTGSSSGVLQAQAEQGASGAAMALIDAKAVQYNSGIQRSYFRLLSSTMTKLIGVLRAYADTPRVARIVGKSKAAGLKEFKYTGEDLNSISSIVYEMVNPISQTQGGRLTMAQDLLKAGALKNPKQYVSLVTTGSLDSLLQDDEADQMLIIEENEALSEGKQVQAVFTEMHEDHIDSHMSVISSVTAKEDPALVESVTRHIQQHMDLWAKLSMANPGYLMATGQKLLPPPQMMGPPPGMVPPGGPGPGAPQGGPGPAPDNQPGPDQQAKQPQLPMNPATGERAQVPGANQLN